MKFQVLDIDPHLKNPVTGEIVSTADRLNQVIETAQRAEEAGYDSFSVGERHAGEFISSSPTTVLAAIAAVTHRIRLQSGVTVLSVLDPVRVAEDYATIDQLSRGRLELVIGKGNEVLQYPLFGLDLADQWELLAEKYGLLRRLWTEENVTWSGRFRPALTEPTTTTPRPFAGAPRVWHGSATSLTSAALAAQWGDPLFTANAIQPRENYKVLIDHYRAEYERHGHDPRHQYLGSGAGAGGVFIADTTQEAKRHFGPVYEALTAGRNVPGNNSPYRDIDHAVAEGPVLVGSPEQVIDKILSYHDSTATTCSPSPCPPRCRSGSSWTSWSGSRSRSSPPSAPRRPPRCGATAILSRAAPTTPTTGAPMSTPTETAAPATAAPAESAPGGESAAAFAAAWAEWHTAHELQRAAPHGFLAVTHLHWLGSMARPPRRRTGHLERGRTTPSAWSSSAGESVLRGGQELNADGAGATVIFEPIEGSAAGLDLVSGDTVIELAKRGGEYIVRPRHPENGPPRRIPGTPTYAPDPEYLRYGHIRPL